jgi:hypothetical protein
MTSAITLATDLFLVTTLLETTDFRTVFDLADVEERLTASTHS